MMRKRVMGSRKLLGENPSINVSKYYLALQVKTLPFTANSKYGDYAED
jgi:hypothetical protein